MGNWTIGPRVGRYRCIPANEREQQALEAINGMEFSALSIGDGPNGKQVAIIPLDESSREAAVLITYAPAMLAELQALVEWADKMTGRAEPEYTPLASARALIAKATGGA